MNFGRDILLICDKKNAIPHLSDIGWEGWRFFNA